MILSKRFEDRYYQKIKDLNIKHYSGEVPYYSKADLRPVEKALLTKLDKRSKILDLGCGSGRFSIGTASLGFNVTGVDITPDAINAATKRARELKLKTVNFKVGDMTDLKIKDNSYDYVICPRFSINAIATFSKRRSAIKEMLRVTRPGGKVFIESFNRFYLGMGIYVLVKNMTIDLIRSIKIFLSKVSGQDYKGLLPEDMIYPSNKVKGASDGYAHITTIFELKKLIPKGVYCKFYSIPEMREKMKCDLLKFFRYSLWLELSKYEA